jgi:hypothetical protein
MQHQLVNISVAELRQLAAAIPPQLSGADQLIITAKTHHIKLLQPLPHDASKEPDVGQLVKYLIREK